MVAWIVRSATGAWSRLQVWLIGGAAIALAIGIAWLKGRSSGKAVIVEQQKQARAEAIVERKKSDEQIDAVSPAGVDAGLDKWMRD